MEAEAVATFLGGHYRHIGAVRRIELLSDGRNRVFRIETDLCDYVAKCGTAPGQAARLLTYAQLAGGLSAAGCAVETPVPSDAGMLACHQGEDSLILLEFVAGNPVGFTVQDFFELGDALARLHAAVDELPEITEALPPLAPLDNLATAPLRLAGMLSASAYEYLAEHCEKLRDRLSGQDLGRPAFCHGDPHPLNALRTAEGVRWLDLEECHVGPRLFDLGTLVWSTIRAGRTAPLWRAALQAYDAVSPISPAALDLIGPFVAIRQIWWLSLHAQDWGQLPLHRQHPDLLETGVELLAIICRDACGL